MRSLPSFSASSWRALWASFVAAALIFSWISWTDGEAGVDSLSSLNIPDDQLPFFLNSHPHLKRQYCSSASSSASSSSSSACAAAAAKGVCWGYEPDCLDPDRRYVPPAACEGDARSWAHTKPDQRRQFFEHVRTGVPRIVMLESITMMMRSKILEESASYITREYMVS